MSVINGQNADATTFNSAFASKSQDNTLQGKQTLAHTGSGATVDDVQQAINDVIASDALKIPTAEKGVANGVATLDATTKVPVAQIPDLTASKITDFNTSADARITLQKGAPSGIAPLDGSSKIDSSYLPSYVDDVVEVANYASLPGTGETGKIYVTLDTNKTYRWSGSVYVQIGQPIASTSDVPEGTNLYFTPARVADKQIGIQFQDQGTNLGTTATVDTIDFIGAGIQATRASNKVTVEVTATGGGGGSKNYFSQSSINPDFETGSVSPWQVMTTTWSGNAPTNAPTPGAVVTTFYTNIVSPLAGTTSAMMTKGLGVGQYEGVMSGVFTIDREDLAKVLYGSFAYEVSGTASANFDVSGTSSQTLEIWVYNVNANQWIQPAGFRGINQFTGPGQVTFSFQTDSLDANNQYRICLIIRQNTGGTWNLKVDDFKVGPQAIVLGTPVTDWQSYTPTYTGLGTVTSSQMYWRRVGANIELRGKFTVGTTTAVETRVSLPSGISSADSTTIPAIAAFGTAYTSANPSNLTALWSVLCNSSQGYITFGLSQDSYTQSLISQTAAFQNSSTVSLFASIPVSGWGSFSQMSNDTDTRVIFASMYQTSNQTVSAGAALPFSSVIYDNSSSLTLATGRFTAPVSGIYQVALSAFARTAVGNTLVLYKNGNVSTSMGILSFGTANAYYSGTYTLQLNAGEYIDVRMDVASTLLGGYTMSVNRISGPSVITATETVAAFGQTTAGLSIPHNSWTIVTTPTIIDSTHNALTTSGVFTAPVSGRYQINCAINFNANGTGVRGMRLRKNGLDTGIGCLSTPQASNVTGSSASGYLKLIAGDTVTVEVFQTSGGSLNLSNFSDVASTFSVVRVGN